MRLPVTLNIRTTTAPLSLLPLVTTVSCSQTEDAAQPITAVLTAGSDNVPTVYCRPSRNELSPLNGSVVAPVAPIGSFDTAKPGPNGCTGWCVDENAYYLSLPVHFHLDGPAGTGTQLGQTTADVFRQDIRDLGYCGSHGFRWTIPAKDAKGRTLYAHALDLSGRAINPVLINSAAPQEQGHGHSGNLPSFSTCPIFILPSISFHTL